MVSRALLSNSVKKNNWIIDSGATRHMCNDKIMFLNIEVFREPREVQVGDGSSVKVIGEGMINLKIELEYGKVRKCRLLRVLYVPDLAYNLLSVSKATSRETGNKVEFCNDGCNIINKNKQRRLLQQRKLVTCIFLNCLKQEEIYSVGKKNGNENGIEDLDTWVGKIRKN